MIQLHAVNTNIKGAGMKRMKQASGRRFESPCRVTTDDVLKCAIGFGQSTWTTHDIAQRLGVNERQVRPAVGWLEHRRLVESAGEVLIGVTRQRGPCTTREHYGRTAYRVVEKGGEPDLETLEMAMGFCRAYIDTLKKPTETSEQ